MNIDEIRDRCLKAIAPLRPAGSSTPAQNDFLFGVKRTAGRRLPPYYLVYFLLIDLLRFRNFGQFEKVAWSVPVEYNGKAFLIEHRKFGLGVFAGNLPDDESEAAEIVKRIHNRSRLYGRRRGTTSVFVVAVIAGLVRRIEHNIIPDSDDDDLPL